MLLCCYYYYDYDKKGLFVFLFGPKLETIDGTPMCLPHSLIVWTRFEQKGTITIAIEIGIAIIDSAVILFILFYFVLFCFRVVESFISWFDYAE